MRWAIVVAGVLGCGASSGGADDGSSGTQGSSGAPSSTEESPDGPSSTAETSSTEGGVDSTGTGGPSPYGDDGPFGIGVQTLTVPGSGRDVLATIWYPSDVMGGRAPLSDLVAPQDAATLDMLLADAPAACVRSQTSATLDAPIANGRFPVVMFSHCLSCLGASSSFVAERMASHGIVVVGVMHTGDTIFERLEGTVAPLDAEWLEVRAQDVRLAFDEVTTTGPLATAIDPSRAGVFGHSYGAATTGKVLQDDDRFLAGVAMAAPVENPLLPGVSTADIAQPMLFILALEDNSILAIGNNLIRQNAAAIPAGSWLVELADAGHWSVSDLCGLVDAFAPGCGDGTRQSTGEPFTYLDAATGREIAAAYVTTFFALHLLGDASADTDLEAADPAEVVTVTRFEPR